MAEQESSRRRERRGPVNAVDVVGAVLAPVAIVCALLGAAALYRQTFPQLQAQPAAEEQAATGTEATQQAQQPAYEGVEDRWMDDGTFTIGDAELDVTIKTFCDALSDGETESAATAAQTVFYSILWGNYTEREEGQKPQGRDWAMVAARLYFNSAHPENGEAGDGDYYEYAAAMALCLRYFGYYYVVALPTIDFDEYGNAVYGAVDYVIDEAGNRYVCDFSKGTYGWMINASYVDIVVDDIGQDLSDANYLGLTVNTSEDTLVTGEDYSGYYEQDETYAGDSGYDTSGMEEGSTGDYEDYGVTGGQEEEATTGTTETYDEAAEAI